MLETIITIILLPIAAIALALTVGIGIGIVKSFKKNLKK